MVEENVTSYDIMEVICDIFNAVDNTFSIDEINEMMSIIDFIENDVTTFLNEYDVEGMYLNMSEIFHMNVIANIAYTLGACDAILRYKHYYMSLL